MKIEAVLTPAEIAGLPQRDLGGATCVVFDVLRATSTMLTALANGARRIYPVSTVEEARALKAADWPDALLGGERGGVRIDGFDLGNSPREYTAERVAGRDIVATTTNGTVALQAGAGAGEVLAGAWLNLDALAVWLRDRAEAKGRLVLVCAGTGAGFALEDGFAAGGLLARLEPARVGDMDDAALGLLAMYEHHRGDPVGTLRRSSNGRQLAKIGLGADVEACAATTTLPCLGIMRGGAVVGEFITPKR